MQAAPNPAGETGDAVAPSPHRATPSPVPRWMTTEQAAAYLSVSPKTMAIWRTEGRGPRYRIIHNRLVRYEAPELDRFVEHGARPPPPG